MFAPPAQRRVALLSRVLLPASLVLLAGTPAFAHIDLLEPEARAHGTAARGDMDIDANSNLKSGPCGQVTSERTERVATYAPGQTITVRVREENAHVSYLRVAIALDGDSFPLRSAVPPAPETQEEARAAEAALGEFGLLAVVRENNDTAGFVHEIEVTLPDATCERCTLQVLQFMYDDPAAPYYFQCADLVLAAASGEPDAGGASGSTGAGAAQSGERGGMAVEEPAAGSEPSASSAGAMPAAPSSPGANTGATSPSGTGAPGNAAPASSPRSGSDTAASSADGGSGCGLARGPGGSVLSLAIAAFTLAALRRRRVAPP